VVEKNRKSKKADPALHTLPPGIKTAVVKVGSAVLADRTGRIDKGVISRIARLCSHWMDHGRLVVLVSSGAIAAGRGVLGWTRPPRSMPEKQALAAAGQIALMEVYKRAFERCGRHVAQILLTREDMDDRRRYLNARYTIENLLNRGVVPIVNENDTTAVEEIEFGDNDVLAAITAVKMQAQLLLILTAVDGLMTAPPSSNTDAELVAKVENVTDQTESLADRAPTPLGRGGMRSKIIAARTATRAGITTILANGREPKTFLLLRRDRVRGTLFVAKSDRHLRRRVQWFIAARSRRNRRILVDAGARRALIEGKKSLLAAGISGVEGEFRPGDVVDIVDSEGRVIGCGLANYSARDIERIKGLRSNRIAAVLGEKPYDEVIHRDNLVIFSELE